MCGFFLKPKYLTILLLLDYFFERNYLLSTIVRDKYGLRAIFSLDGLVWSGFPTVAHRSATIQRGQPSATVLISTVSRGHMLKLALQPEVLRGGGETLRRWQRKVGGGRQEGGGRRDEGSRRKED